MNVAVAGNFAYVADFRSGMQILDIAAPADPVLAGSYYGSTTAYGVMLADNLAYVSGGYGIQILSVENTCSITITGDVTTNGVITSADIIYEVGYVFKGGPSPCDICGAMGLGWSCP